MIEQSATTIRCPRCGQALAQGDGHTLYIGAVLIERLVTLWCAAVGCGGRVVWRPAMEATNFRRTLAPP